MTSPLFETRFPVSPVIGAPADAAQAYLIVARDFRQSGRLREADLVLAEGVRRFPDNVPMLIEYAELATALDDVEAMLSRWQSVRDRAPHVANAWRLPSALLLRRLGRRDEADKLLAEGVEKFPDHADIALEYAWSAVLRGDLAAASQRYDVVRQRFPALPAGHSALAGSLRDLGNYDAADSVAEAALPRFPTDRNLLLAYAWTAQYRRDAPEAVRRWALVRQHIPDERLGYIMAARTIYTEMHSAADAEPILAAGVGRFPEDLELGREFATNAGARGDLAEALRRWQELAARFPGDASVIAGRGDAELRLRTQMAEAAMEASAPGSAIPAAQSAAAAAPLRDFFLQFESIGHNCEFGLVQRHFGAEPLGLLRWNALTPTDLTVALEHRFEGVGQPENIELQLYNGEYLVVEKRYRMGMHTFLMAAEVKVSPERLHAQMCRRMQFLKDKFLDDLSLGQKLLVYRCWETIPDAALHRLFAALRRYGDNTLLYVRAGAAPERVGHVEVAEPGLLLGDIDRFVRDGDGWDKLSVDAWLTLCRNAYKLWRPTG